VIEHWRFVFLAFSNDHDAVRLDGAKHGSHRINSSSISGVIITPADPARSGHRRRLGHPN
jgi:hypothetical protein